MWRRGGGDRMRGQDGGDDPSVKGLRIAFGGKGRVGGGGKLPKDGSCLS